MEEWCWQRTADSRWLAVFAATPCAHVARACPEHPPVPRSSNTYATRVGEFVKFSVRPNVADPGYPPERCAPARDSGIMEPSGKGCSALEMRRGKPTPRSAKASIW